ncbi:hypothetical protein [Agromyces subbeticus]|uniref:hypothetical protein n=1 Tax=Agromyces subbeticus TaxID=293890 RepID=UPI0003B67D0A|nr:hypothetical protein [Agromyces subbeticus]
MRRLPLIAAGLGMVVVVLLVSGCARNLIGEPIEVTASSSPTGEVTGDGTVREADGSAPELCLGGVAESYPPQCSGPEIVGWEWSRAEGEETASGVTWGGYSVRGTWDGERFTLTEPPVPHEPGEVHAMLDPRFDPANAGDSTETELDAVQAELRAEVPSPLPADGRVPYLASWTENGYVVVLVIFDDGAAQRRMDDRFGDGRVIVLSALAPVA